MKNISYKILEQEVHIICSLERAKNYLRITHDHDDALINNLINAAIEHAELFTGLTLSVKKLELSIQQVKDNMIVKYIPFLELCSVDLQESKVEIDNMKQLCNINMQDNILNFHSKLYGKDIKIIYKAGYADGKVPHSILQGILLYISTIYDYGELNQTSIDAIRKLYIPYRKLRV